MGLGSRRLLTAALQRAASAHSTVVLIDEVELGLEPHRLIKLLEEIGVHETTPPFQVFMTTHSPTAVREMATHQLMVIRKAPKHAVAQPSSLLQGTIRKYPEALLGRAVVVCEGASEVGLLRGLDNTGDPDFPSVNALGVALIDGHGDEHAKRALAFQQMGYPTAIFRDNDKAPQPEEIEFVTKGGVVFTWPSGAALEDMLFHYLPDAGIAKLIDLATEFKDADTVNGQITTASANVYNLSGLVGQALVGSYDVNMRTCLAKASKNRTAAKAWYKSVSAMEQVAETVILPNKTSTHEDLMKVATGLFQWMMNATV